MAKLMKPEKLRQQLVERIGQMDKGQRFLSVRGIMKQYNVSQTTVDQTLTMLETNGLLYREHGKGMFIRDTDIDQMNVCFLVPHWPSMTFTEMYEDLLSEAQRQGHRLQMRTYPPDQDIWNHLPEKEFDGIIFMHNADYISPQCLHRLINASIPVVIRGIALKEIHISSVAGNSMAGGALAASYLIQKGHRRLALLLSAPISSSSSRDRVDGFLMMAQSNNVPVTVLDCKVKSGEFHSEKSCAFLKDWLKNNEVQFTAMHTLDDETAQVAMPVLADHGLSVPDDISVIGYGGFRRSAFFHPPLTTICTDQQIVSRETFNALKAMVADRSNIVKKLIMPHVLERASVTSPRH